MGRRDEASSRSAHFVKARKDFTAVIVDTLHFCQTRVIAKHSYLSLYFRSMLTPYVEEICGSPVWTSVQ